MNALPAFPGDTIDVTASADMRASRTASLLRSAASAANPRVPGVVAESFSRGALVGAVASTSAASTATPRTSGCRTVGAARDLASKALHPDRLFSGKPRSLEIPAKTPADGAAPPRQGLLVRLALSLGGFYSKESTNQRAADRLYASAVAQAEDENLMDALQIERSFRGEHAALTLHVWLILSRLRREGARGKELSQVMYDTFQDDVEHRVHAEGVRVRVNKWLNELEQGFYGSALAYDKALQGGAGDLAKVLHRNVYHGEGDEGRARTLERYVRRELGCLSMTRSEAVLEGRVRFSKTRD